jgi:hypothetical protein
MDAKPDHRSVETWERVPIAASRGRRRLAYFRSETKREPHPVAPALPFSEEIKTLGLGRRLGRTTYARGGLGSQSTKTVMEWKEQHALEVGCELTLRFYVIRFQLC